MRKLLVVAVAAFGLTVQVALAGNAPNPTVLADCLGKPQTLTMAYLDSRPHTTATQTFPCRPF